MYEDSWYNFVPDFQQRRGQPQEPDHRRKNSFIQPHGANTSTDPVKPLPDLFDLEESHDDLPEYTLPRRPRSYSNLREAIQSQLREHGHCTRDKKRRRTLGFEALAIATDIPEYADHAIDFHHQLHDDFFQSKSRHEQTLYHDQLAMTERHLEALIIDTNGALGLLASLSNSFRGVEEQTSSFRSQCQDLLAENDRLQKLASDVGNDLRYYMYLDDVTRRLNAPGSRRLVESGAFGGILSNLDACINFMDKKPMYRDAESYLARYQALLVKALHFLEVGFADRLEKVSSELSKQIANMQSESARHALAYGRYEELVVESHSLVHNVQTVVLSAYDSSGNAKDGDNVNLYRDIANNLFQIYLAARDRDLKPVVQSDLDTFKSEAQDLSVETAARNYIKQSFERSYSEAGLFAKVFSIEPHFSTDSDSAFAALKVVQRYLVNGVNIVPIASNLQAALQSQSLGTLCNVVGWLTDEYLSLEYDEEDTHYTRHCRVLAARLLEEHLWHLTDATFEAEIFKSISKASVPPEDLKIGPVVNGISSSNAYPPVKRALELLVLFDRSMPKERCQRDSPVVYRIVKESIATLQRAEARIKATRNGTDPDLFMIKNLLIVKNELMSLEIGDVRAQGAGSMQHFGQIWETLTPQGLMGFLSSLGNYIPGASSLWPLSRGGTSSPAPGRADSGVTTPMAAGAGGAADRQDDSEHLDNILRQSIYAFTNRWATITNEARAARNKSGDRTGANALDKALQTLDDLLNSAFAHQPEVVAKLKEAIHINAQTQADGVKEKSRGV